jgi:predicted O-methyltransferase YrrM
MKRALVVSLIMFAVISAAVAQRRGPGPGFGRFSDAANPPQAKTETEKKILGVLDAMVKVNEMYSNVPMGDGRILRLLTESIGAKQVAEFGTSTGYSGLWFCMALEKSGGKLTTFDIDPGRIALARKHFQQAGVEHMVTIIEGDAHQTIGKLKGPLDLVFIDADKEGYVDYLNKVLPLVRPGGLILAHNTNSAPDYVRAVIANSDLDTVFAGEGNTLGITLKKR